MCSKRSGITRDMSTLDSIGTQDQEGELTHPSYRFSIQRRRGFTCHKYVRTCACHTELVYKKRYTTWLSRPSLLPTTYLSASRKMDQSVSNLVSKEGVILADHTRTQLQL